MRDGSAAGPDVTIDLFGGPIFRVRGDVVTLSPLQACLVAVVFGHSRRPGPGMGRPGSCPEAGPSRREVVRLLWDEDSPESRHRLSQLLYSFTKKAGGTGLFDAGPEIVSPGRPAEAGDLRRFRDLLEGGDLLPAMELLDRGYLSGLTLIPGRRFEEWLERERARLRRILRQTATARWSRLSASEEWHGAIDSAETLLRLDPEDEEALRNVLLAKGMAGRVHEALAEYAGFSRSHTSEESGGPVEAESAPDPRTARLLERLRSLADEHYRTERRPRGPDLEPALCGREEELALLNRTIGRGDDDTDPVTVVVRGEAGIGKTRLVREAIRGARLRGFTVLQAGSSEFERDIPLNPLLEALDREDSGSAIHDLEEPWRSVILSLLPQFHRGSGPLPEVPYVEPGNLPRRTYEALRRLIENLTRKSPILLFLDDFQWADETSVAAVEFLRRRWNGGRLVIVLALRPSASTRPSRAAHFTQDLIQSGEALQIQLGELDHPAADALIESVVERSMDPVERRRISQLGGRNPFFTVELAHEYVQGRLELRTAPGEPIPVPVSIRQLLERRLQELTPLAEKILETLSVLGSRCCLPQIADLCGGSRSECAEAVDHLQAARLIRWEDGGFTLRHQLVQHTVYSRLKEASRRLLHERIAEWLRDTGDGGPEELAIHFDRAGRREEALDFSLKAADKAEASGAVPEAVRLLTTARRNTSDPVRAADIVGRLGHLHHMHRNFTEAAPLLDVAAERFRQQDRIGRALAAEAKKIDALSRLELLPLQDFLQKAEELKEEAREREQWETLTQLLDVEIHTLDREGEVDAVRRVLKEAEELCDKGSPTAQCAARATLAIDVFYRNPSDGILHATRAVKIAREAKLTDKLLFAGNRLALCLMIQGRFDLDRGESLYEEIERVAETSGDLFQRFNLVGNRGIWHSDKGEYERARWFFDKAGRIIRDTPAVSAKIALNLNAGECEFLARNIEDARECFRRANRLLPEARTGKHVEELVAAGLGLCALYQGDLAEARAREGDVHVARDEWVFDPFAILLFKARMYERRREFATAAAFIREHTGRIENRFVTTWLKLKLEEARIWRKVDNLKAHQAAEEGRSTAKALRLLRLCSRFDSLLQ